jgi:hypothetical protein
MRNQSLIRVVFACTAFGLAPLTEVRAELLYRVPGDFGWRKSLPLQLILDKDVIEDLGLNEEVARKLKQLHEKVQTEVEAERRKPLDDRQNKPRPNWWVQTYQWNDEILHTVRNRHRQDLDELLTTQQQERLYQIHLQRQPRPANPYSLKPRPTDALSDSGVAKELGLTDAQRAQIYQIQWEPVKAERDEVKGVDKDTTAGSGDLYRACPEKVMKVLTDEQRQAFERLRGKPLKTAEKP